MNNYGTSNLEQLVARHLAGINPPPAQAPSALGDLDVFVRALPPEERRALDADVRVMTAKNALLTAFMDYLLGATPFGSAFCAGLGAPLAQALLDTVKTAHREIAGKLESEQQAAQRKGEEMEARYLELERKYAQLCEQLGVNDAANP